MNEAPEPPHYYLRLSITAGCAFRCPYCQPEGLVAGVGRKARLSVDEIAYLIDALARLGVTRVRLTGGEPLGRHDCAEIVERIHQVAGIHEVALTTNGEQLAGLAGSLRRAGLDRINVHIDSLRPERYRELTGRDSLPRVLAGLRAARAAVLDPVKVNTVLMRDVNDDELLDFCALARDEGVVVRFIELMNTGPAAAFVRKHFLSAAEARRLIERRFELVPRFEDRGASPAREYCLAGGGTVGFIASESEPFCESCNRIRITADGRLKVCLYDPAGINLRPLLDVGINSEKATRILMAALGAKRSYHPIMGEAGERPFSMVQVGG